ncbi:MAG: bifunctional phosphoribosylaminoimidazolecarboxamide formyltransferase/IMP cyclohydrolase [Clostridiales bacterium]|jgi:phosphoribosylaminoimidazolecarboxamide formyltransferase/IMP cyclohydrolase|nr:bifunctional phosphoribosylaminoimidazolecarboxamide formyltransferase/IMP cyclohydrolase [Clostridiales bacterium]
MKKRAIISLSDKTGAVDFARGLCGHGFEIISTGSTGKMLADAGIKTIQVPDVTGFPECLDGRVKTLHPAIHGGILARRDVPAHMDFLREHGIGAIDIVCVNLYPFKQTILKPGVHLDEAIENIDIGGPAMLRSAAKNHDSVAVIVDTSDYPKILQELSEHGELSQKTRLYLAAKAFAHTAAYDALITQYLGKMAGLPEFPDNLTLTYEKAMDLRYGENPHQAAAFYREIGPAAGTLANARRLHGKELSFNNINDTHGALELCREFDENTPTIVAVKHATPCGVGCGENLRAAWQKAYDADPVSIFGGVIAANCEVDADTAAEIDKIFVEIVIAPSFSDKAMKILTKKKNIRLLVGASFARPPQGADIKKVDGGLLIQSANNMLLPLVGAGCARPPECVTERKPTEAEMKDLLFAWKLVKHVKSNGIAIGKDGASIGLAGGQVSRIRACKQAIAHAHEFLGEESTHGAALASDAFFPFPDCVEEAHKAGITAIIQPGGSQGDAASIETCNKYGIAMVFTGMRHFRH